MGAVRKTFFDHPFRLHDQRRGGR